MWRGGVSRWARRERRRRVHRRQDRWRQRLNYRWRYRNHDAGASDDAQEVDGAEAPRKHVVQLEVLRHLRGLHDQAALSARAPTRTVRTSAVCPIGWRKAQWYAAKGSLNSR